MTAKGWMDIETAAQELGVPLEVVKEAVEKRQLPALILGEYIRISRDALIESVRLTQDEARPSGSGPKSQRFISSDQALGVLRDARSQLEKNTKLNGVPLPEGVGWVRGLAQAESFTHHWPDGTDEDYVEAWSGQILLRADSVEVTVGRATRYQRGRLTVFLNRYPAAEFFETKDGNGWASLIKPDGRKTLRLGETPPVLYQSARLESYREAIGLTGSGFPRAIAIVIEKDDYLSAVHHAAARRLGKGNVPIKPAL